MTEQNLSQVGGVGFEELKHINKYGREYWTVRDLQPLLGYHQWRSGGVRRRSKRP
jgi:DNA-damage-inducible protein D